MGDTGGSAPGPNYRASSITPQDVVYFTFLHFYFASLYFALLYVTSLTLLHFTSFTLFSFTSFTLLHLTLIHFIYYTSQEHMPRKAGKRELSPVPQLGDDQAAIWDDRRLHELQACSAALNRSNPPGHPHTAPRKTQIRTFMKTGRFTTHKALHTSSRGHSMAQDDSSEPRAHAHDIQQVSKTPERPPLSN